MTIVARQQLGREAWDAAAESSAEAWFWHRYDACDTTIRDWPGRSDSGFAVVCDRGEVEALVPAYTLETRTSFGLPIRYLNSMGGPALAPNLGRSRRQQTLEAIADELRRRASAAHAIRASISLSTMAPALRGPDGPRCNPLLYMGCEDDSGQTWIADLRDGSEVAWKRLEGRARTNVRRAEAAGVTVRHSTDPQDWHVFFELHKATYQRLGVPAYPAALFRAIFEQLIPAGLCDVQFAELNGTPIAANNFVCYKQGGHFWDGFASDAGLEANAITLLIWSSMKRLAESGILQWLDCGDAVMYGRDKHRQLSDFKRSFGGELYRVFRGRINGTSKLYDRLVHLRGLIGGSAV